MHFWTALFDVAEVCKNIPMEKPREIAVVLNRVSMTKPRIIKLLLTGPDVLAGDRKDSPLTTP